MARKIPNNPLFDAEAERKALGIEDDPTEGRRKTGRPRREDIVRDNAAQAGLTSDWTRATFIVREEYLNKMKDYAYTERISLKEAVDKAFSEFLKDKTDLLQHK